MKKQALTAALLTAALALGTVPAAFADPGVGESTDRQLSNKGTTGTTVKAETTVDQIVAALPVDMTIAVHTKGGAVDVPSAAAYKIVNKSIFPIKVASATAAETDGWELKADVQAAGTVPTGTIGDLQLVMTPKTGAAWNIANAYTADSWKIPAKTTADGELTFTISSTSSGLKKTFSSATKAVTLTYTIAADDTAPVAS